MFSESTYKLKPNACHLKGKLSECNTERCFMRHCIEARWQNLLNLTLVHIKGLLVSA